MNETELREAFEKRRPQLEALGRWVTETILLALENELGSKAALDKFLQIPPRPRVKETDSFLEKALVRKPKKDPLTEITDQVGVRFVVLLLEDIARVGKVIEAGPWLWRKDRDHDQERLKNPDYFAYQSDHYIITTRQKTQYLEIEICIDMSCEIQIRTILQHAYAEMAHGSDYKPSIRLPEEEQRKVRRALAKGSALIETTDDVFREIKERLREYGLSIDNLLAKSGEIYTSITKEPSSGLTQLGVQLADVYRDLVKDLTPEDLQLWVDAKPWLGDKLSKKRYESVFFRDPVIILLGCLISKYEMAIPKRWPLDGSYLEDLYIMLGISTVGLV